MRIWRYVFFWTVVGPLLPLMAVLSIAFAACEWSLEKVDDFCRWLSKRLKL